jgi:signal transduction histidine kinase
MNNRLYKRNLITAAMIVVVLFISTMITIYKFINMDFNVYDNDIRILVAEQKNQLENNIYNKGKYPYLVFGLEGEVLYNDTSFGVKPGDIINVQEMLQTDKSFKSSNNGEIKESFVLQHKGKTYGFVVFLIPEKDINIEDISTRIWKVFYPSVFGIITSIFIVLMRTMYLNRRILKPLGEIGSSARAIIKGNYDLEVVRVYEKVIGENEVGDLIFSFELMRDELKEKQLREESLKKSQQELISCISHDLKTPISTIKAYSEGLRDGIAKTPEAQENFVKIIISKTDLLIEMIKELLEYSNIQLKQLDINPQEVYLLDYFIPLMKEVEVFVKLKGIKFSYEIKTDNMILNIDQRRITEVLYNLLENSIKYIGEEHGNISIEIERQGTFALIKVKDNGKGISVDDIPYVFDKFYRAEKSRSSSIPGSGLGLSICKYIVEEHGGEIYCKSGHNKGCEFGFTLQ